MPEINFWNIVIITLIVFSISIYYLSQKLLKIIKDNFSEGLWFILAMVIGLIIFSPILAIMWFFDRNIGKPQK